MVDVGIGLHCIFNGSPERGRRRGMSCEMESDGWEDKLGVVAITEARTEEAGAEKSMAVAPVGHGLCYRGFPGPRHSVDP